MIECKIVVDFQNFILTHKSRVNHPYYLASTCPIIFVLLPVLN